MIKTSLRYTGVCIREAGSVGEMGYDFLRARMLPEPLAMVGNGEWAAEFIDIKRFFFFLLS